MLLFTSSVRYAAGELRLYHYAFDRYDAEARTGIARSELDRAARELVAYFKSDEPVVSIRVQHNGREVSLFNQRETAHLADVKDLFQMTFRVQEVALAYVLLYVVAAFVWAREVSARSLSRLFLAGAGLTLAAIALVGLAALASFDALWEQFHVVIFPNDLWRLNPRTDHLIQMFPERFWLDATLLVTGLTALVAGLMAGVAGLYLWRTTPGATVPPGVRALLRQRAALRRQ